MKTESRTTEQEFMSFALRAADMGTWELDFTTGRQRWSPRQYELLGFPPDREVTLEEALGRIHPEDLPSLREALARAVQGGEAEYRTEYRVILPGGAVRWLAAHGKVYCDKAGRAVCMAGVNYDISERKEAEAERERLLAEIERRATELDSIILSIADGVVVYDGKGEIVRINPAAEQLVGFTPEVLHLPIGERWSRMKAQTSDGHPLSPEEVPASRALRGEILRGETIVLHFNSREPLWVSASAGPIEINGEIVGAVATFTDITGMQQLQQEKETFLHTITHDLRTPLSVILGHAEMLQTEIECAGLGEAPRINIESILVSGRQMAKMTEDLVDLARLEGGRIDLQPEAVDLPGFLASFLSRFRVAIDIARISADIPSGLPPLCADPRLLERCLGNLVSNAFKYSAADSRVIVAARPEGDYVRISVQDFGKGIPPEILPHVFERFYRARDAGQGGIGLGLFIVRSLVEAQGGRVWAESEPGRGSTFFFTLPVAQEVHSVDHVG